MLYISLVLSAILLVLTNWVVRRVHRPVVPVMLLAFAFAFGQMLLVMFSVALALQAGAVALLALTCCGIWERPRLYLPLSLAGTVMAYGIVAYYVNRDLSELRGQFPYVSMEERLPPLKPHRETATRYDDLALVELEDSLDATHQQDGHRQDLEQLHEHTVETFVSRPGFGVVRMVGVSKWTLNLGKRSDSPIPQPSPEGQTALSTGLDLAGLERADLVHEGSQLHRASILDFVEGLGFVKDRRHVAGFQEHRFSEVPAGDSWQVRTLDLVSLVLHEQPVAYVSANLPKMDELRDAPTRPLDTFEFAGLETIRRGKELFVRGTPDGVRMLGAIRAAKQCIECHGGERGDLLGAFSYTLAPKNRP
jgi:hypothetical protein